LRTIKLTIPLLIGDAHHEAGGVVQLPERRAEELVRHGLATPVERVGGAEEAKAEAVDPEAAAITKELLGFHGVELPKPKAKASKPKPDPEGE
jgi:hypothetical protein